MCTWVAFRTCKWKWHIINNKCNINVVDMQNGCTVYISQILTRFSLVFIANFLPCMYVCSPYSPNHKWGSYKIRASFLKCTCDWSWSHASETWHANKSLFFYESGYYGGLIPVLCYVIIEACVGRLHTGLTDDRG